MKGRRRTRWVLVTAVGAAAVVAVATLVLFVVRRSGGGPNLNDTALVSVSRPGDGSIVALHQQHTVLVESYDPDGVAEIQLWINDQLWGSAPVSAARDRVTHTWAWIPSGEGEHHLSARAIDATGASTESASVRVFASASVDVRFPQAYTAVEGDTLEGIATRLGSTTEGILESNPQVDPQAPIPPGTEMIIPVPIPVPAPETESGEPAAPPSGNPLLPPGSSVQSVAESYAAGKPLVGGAFSFIDGILKPNEPVELLFLYLSVNGKDWGRIPEDPKDYLVSPGGSFDLTSELKSVVAQAGTDPVQIQAEVWAWRQGALTLLGYYLGEVSTEGGGLQTTATGATQVRMIDFTYLGKEHYKQFAVLTGDDPDLLGDFRWTTSLSGVTYGLWQVSDKAFPPGSVLNPPNLVHQGVSKGEGGTFSLNFKSYFFGDGGGGPGGFGGLGGIDLPSSLDDLLGLTQDPEKQFVPWLPKVFFVRVVPMKGAPGFTQEVAGPPSPSIAVFYTPVGKPYSPKSPPDGPVYEAHVVGFEFYRPADPDYAACMVTNYEVRDCRNVFGYDSKWWAVGFGAVESGQLTMAEYQQCQITSPKGLLACGCPGVSCDSSDSGCSVSPSDWGSCVQEGVEAFGGALGTLASLGADLYNGAVDFITDTLSSVACGPLSGEAKKACEAGVGIAVNAGLASLGLPPEIPNFEKLMNEGLDYALAVAAEQLSAQLGFECDKFCQDLIQAGIEGVSDPEKLMDNGLAFAASHAADQLKDLGVECDAKCQGLIVQAAHGDLQASVAFNTALDKAAAEAAAQLNANGYACDSACQTKIRESMEDARDLVLSAQDTAAAKPTPPLLLPHPLAVAQPAVVTVEIFRRWESAGIPQEDLNHCGLTVFTSETSPLAGTPYTFAPFNGVGLELPAIDPGETIRIPIALDRKFLDITPEMTEAVFAALQAQGDPYSGIAGAISAGLIDGQIVDGKVLAAWNELYYNGTLQVKLSGPAFFTAGGGGAALPCVADETFSTAVPNP